ncbi:MAG: LON peptidase substrate-binding domain-containing protein [Rhodobacteraceae bacterium]|nr:LON peptidase substrate-binding domain-containing protein [Paracoccaceae bacterium]MCB1367407.1 LON peptidase substrate-binding domain-containing protein [Paracoccaceae bacterium]
MFNPVDLPDVIPLFPLPGALLLPRARLPLNIFEPRYLAMLEDTLKTPHRLIGMVQPIEPASETRPERLHAIGCAGRVVAFSETDDGRYMITLGGVSRFRTRHLHSGFEPYLRSEIDWSGFARDRGKPETDDSFDRPAFLALLGRYFHSTGVTSDWGSLEKAGDELLINSLSMLCPFGVEDKQALLEAPTLVDRRETLVTLMEFALAGSGDNGALQ